MNDGDEPPPTGLTLERVIAASPERVYSALTRPEELGRWWGAAPEHRCSVAEVDLRVGGRYRLGMRAPEGGEYVAGGEYREIVPNRRLVFTWRWEHSAEAFPTTVVTIELAPHPAGCRLRLHHARLPDREQARLHREGWAGCLARLAASCEREEPPP